MDDEAIVKNLTNVKVEIKEEIEVHDGLLDDADVFNVKDTSEFLQADDAGVASSKSVDGESVSEESFAQKYIKWNSDPRNDCGSVFPSSSRLLEYILQMKKDSIPEPYSSRYPHLKSGNEIVCSTPISNISFKKNYPKPLEGSSNAQTNSTQVPEYTEKCDVGVNRIESILSNIFAENEERYYKCAECGKRFKRSSNYKEHLRTHSKEKPFGCPQCYKKFKRPGNLKCHLRIHTGEKPFACTICDKEYSCSSNLKRHTLTHNIDQNEQS